MQYGQRGQTRASRGPPPLKVRRRGVQACTGAGSTEHGVECINSMPPAPCSEPSWSNGMRRTCLILALTACAMLARTATAGEPFKGTSPQLPEPPSIGPCASPGCSQAGIGPNCACQCRSQAMPAYSLTPGCCESRRHCFDNAWDGYCQERARHDTFWCKFGTGALYPCTPCATHDGRGVALEVQLRPAAAACGCQKH
jgi:hypothetical protein